MQRIFRNRKGFTLIELLLGISVFTLIVIALIIFSKNIFNYSSFISSGLNDVNTGRQAMKVMTAEIRTASTASTGAYTIALANSTTFTFYSDIDDDGLKEKVRYFLNGTSLEKGVIKPTGNPLTYNSANEVITTLALYVRNTSIFNYYDKNYDGTTAPLTLPVNPSSIRLIKITINVDKDLSRPPGESIFSTQISIRNLKDNL